MNEIDLSKPSLKALSHILRNRDHWPEGFQWCFGISAHCAIGLSCETWNLIDGSVFLCPTLKLDKILSSSFNIPIRTNDRIFWGSGYQDAEEPVTPEMVADKIDEYLEDVEHGKELLAAYEF